MAVKPIRLFGDPVLRTPAEPVKDFDKELRTLVKDLSDTILDAPGVGLAAPQLGVGLRVFTYYVDERLGHVVNPTLKLSDEELEATIHREDRDIRVLYLDGAPAGFFDVKPYLPQEAELAYFGMMEHAQGQGIGRWFLGAAIEACWSHDPRKVTVQTCTLDHPAALPLYQKLGFRPVAQKKEVVQPITPAERSASVMR